MGSRRGLDVHTNTAGSIKAPTHFNLHLVLRGRLVYAVQQIGWLRKQVLQTDADEKHCGDTVEEGEEVQGTSTRYMLDRLGALSYSADVQEGARKVRFRALTLIGLGTDGPTSWSKLMSATRGGSLVRTWQAWQQNIEIDLWRWDQSSWRVAARRGILMLVMSGANPDAWRRLRGFAGLRLSMATHALDPIHSTA